MFVTYIDQETKEEVKIECEEIQSPHPGVFNIHGFFVTPSKASSDDSEDKTKGQ